MIQYGSQVPQGVGPGVLPGSRGLTVAVSPEIPRGHRVVGG